MKPNLRSVSSELPDPPYPTDTKANGYNVEFDIQRIRVSDTWVLAKPDERPWLLMIWFEAWSSVPVGSMPESMEVFAARIGCTPEFLQAHAKTLLRGWTLHSDARLYHSYIVESVLEMKRRRRGATERMRKHRDKKCDASPSVTDASPSVTYAKEQEQEQDLSIPPKGGRQNSREFCPFSFAEIQKIWKDVLPSLPQPTKATATRKARLRARAKELPTKDDWRKLFERIAKSDFLMGKNEPAPGHESFRCTFDWVTKPDNLVKIQEGCYDNAQRKSHGSTPTTPKQWEAWANENGCPARVGESWEAFLGRARAMYERRTQ